VTRPDPASVPSTPQPRYNCRPLGTPIRLSPHSDLCNNAAIVARSQALCRQRVAIGRVCAPYGPASGPSATRPWIDAAVMKGSSESGSGGM
jgi:hypothetical protein